MESIFHPPLCCVHASVCLCVQWVLADESTGVAGTHQQLSALDKPHEQVLISSMWDIPTPFRVRIIGLDRLKKEMQVRGGEGREGRGGVG